MTDELKLPTYQEAIAYHERAVALKCTGAYSYQTTEVIIQHYVERERVVAEELAALRRILARDHRLNDPRVWSIFNTLSAHELGRRVKGK